MYVLLGDRAWSGVRAAERDARVPRYVEATVEVVGDPLPGQFRTRAVVRLAGRHVLASADRSSASHLVVADAGDRLTLRGTLGPLTSEEAARWHHRHVGARLDVVDVTAARPADTPLLRAANRFRRIVLRATEALPAPQRGLAAGFLVGDTRGIPDSVIDDFRAAGISHLLAVSGANVAFVLALASPVLMRFQLRGRFVGSLAVIVLFAAATRFEPSVLRASTMAAIAALAAFVGRPASGLRLLAYAVAGLLLFDPLLIHSVGFRLSCGASAGIVVLSAPIASRLRGPRPIREAVAVTGAAQIGVLPVLIPIFGSVPLATLPANVICAPLAAPVTLWGLASGVAASVVGPFLPEAAEALQAPTYLLVSVVNAVAGAGAAVPWSIDAKTVWGLAAVACLVAAGRKWTRRLRAR